MTSDVVFMAPLMIIDPIGTTARAAVGTIPSAVSTPRVAVVAMAIAAKAIIPLQGTRLARPRDVRLATPTITAMASTVSQPWPPKM
jgi:hypothetical protein